MSRLCPIAVLLPLIAGCCCCGGGFGGSSNVPAEQLAGAKSLNLSGAGDITVTVGTEPYAIDTEAAPLSGSTIAGSDLTISVTLGLATASLPQLDSITVAEVTGLTLNGVDVSDLTIAKTGFGGVSASGKATNVTVDAGAQGMIDLTSLTAENVTVNITGDGTSVEVHATGKLTVNIDGNGSSVKYSGGAELTENITGSSSVTNLDGDETDNTTDGVDVDAVEPDADGLEPTVLDGEGFGEQPEPVILDGEGFGELAPQSAVPNAIGD